MLTEDKILKFYADVQALGLRFPVAEIVRKTGETKGNVSDYLNKKKVPSKNFIDKFYEGFHEELNKNQIKLTTVTTKPNFGDDKPAKPLNETLVNTVASQQETIKKLTETLIQLIEKR